MPGALAKDPVTGHIQYDAERCGPGFTVKKAPVRFVRTGAFLPA
jgi:hypothetical protein